MSENLIDKILQVHKYTIFDVFFGEGWDNWIRVFIKQKKGDPAKHVIYLAGTVAENSTEFRQVVEHFKNAV